jgi:hypothetical protein
VSGPVVVRAQRSERIDRRRAPVEHAGAQLGLQDGDPRGVLLDERAPRAAGIAVQPAAAAVELGAVRHEPHRRAERRAHRARDGAAERERAEAVVAGEHLVAAVAGERDGDLRPGEPAHEVRRDGGRVGVRLVVVPEQRVHEAGRVDGDGELGVARAEVLGDGASVGGFVEARVLGEADRERLDRLGRGLGHERDDERGVDAAREQGAHRDVGDHAPLHRRPQERRQAGRRLVG